MGSLHSAWFLFWYCLYLDQILMKKLVCFGFDFGVVFTLPRLKQTK